MGRKRLNRNKKYMIDIEDLYRKLEPETFSYKLESLYTVKLIHDIRYFWKPKKVKTLLLAESHVFTPDSDIQIGFEDAFLENANLQGYPSQFANFVYCIGYGEKNILTSKPASKNGGTWQFWQLFNATCEHKYKVLAKSEKDVMLRVKEKIALLTEMKNKGIWLLDCSFLAVYNVGAKPSKKEMDKILSYSFSHYCLPIIKEEKPERVIVIGKTVFDVISKTYGEVISPNWDWIHQPNARISNEIRKSLSSFDFG